MSIFLILRFIHIAAAIVAVGSNVTYAFWLRRQRAEAVDPTSDAYRRAAARGNAWG